PAFYQCAPEDQQLKAVTGGEDVTLNNLHSKHPFISFRIPDVGVEFESKIDDELSSYSGRIQTVVIEPDNLRLQIVWLGKIKVPDMGQTLEHTTVTHKIISL
ncbi:MAG: DUF2169 domain-containing protein, partial [Proteobacteria bacterium]|nr:DUF2169 domain-containing protein [Pseudomonadota bacterium]